ncbi:MAG: type II secretion system protein [Campylobacterota bacterium]|nr:type II secretion system protein [Campylobacterota bacterium]
MTHFYKRGAFTLIEILVVLVIMGFLVAMVAPKLAGVISDSYEPIDDTNQKELSKVFHDFISLKERAPRGMLNLIDEDNSSNTYKPLSVYIMDGDAILSEDFNLTLVPVIHHLNADEALELRRLGISSVRNYKHTYSGGTMEYNSEATIASGVAVLMLGCGVDNGGTFDWVDSLEGSITDDNAGNITYSKTTPKAFDNDDANIYAFDDTAPYLGRIIMGIDNENELVTGGFLDVSGSSPKETKNDEIKYRHYSVLLPRLQATVQRMGTKKTLHLRKYDKKVKNGYGQKIVKMDEDIQDLGDIVIVSPQGYISRDKDFSYGVKIQ